MSGLLFLPRSRPARWWRMTGSSASTVGHPQDATRRTAGYAGRRFMGSGRKGMAALRLWQRPAALAVVLARGVAHGAGGVCERIVITGNPDYPPLLWVNPDDPGRLVGAA